MRTSRDSAVDVHNSTILIGKKGFKNVTKVFIRDYLQRDIIKSSNRLEVGEIPHSLSNRSVGFMAAKFTNAVIFRWLAEGKF